MLNKVLAVMAAIVLPLAASAGDRFVPADFEVPAKVETAEFRIRMLTVNDVVKDYDAVMSSLAHLQGMFLDHWGWPTAELSLEQDLIDLGWHQKEFQNRTSFAYTVVTLDESRVLGCIYVFPFKGEGYDADVALWVRSDVLKTGMDERLFQTVKSWMADDWPFEKVAYPGRDLSWETYKELTAR